MNNQELISLLDEKLPRRLLYVSFAAVFLPCYFYCIATYGFLWGVGFGWLPSGIVAFAFWVLLFRVLRRLIIWYDPVVRGDMSRRRREERMKSKAATSMPPEHLGAGQRARGRLQQIAANPSKYEFRVQKSPSMPCPVEPEPLPTPKLTAGQRLLSRVLEWGQLQKAARQAPATPAQKSPPPPAQKS